jgi:hypothetical protein
MTHIAQNALSSRPISIPRRVKILTHTVNHKRKILGRVIVDTEEQQQYCDRKFKTSMPCTRSLFKTINSLDQATEIFRMSRINKPKRLPHINFLLKYSMKEIILNIKLTEQPTSSNSQ